MRKGYLTPPVIIILALITFGVALTLYFNTNLLKNIKNKPTPSPESSVQTQPSPTPDETANWKTYTNSNLGFSLKYPEFLCVESRDTVRIELRNCVIDEFGANYPLSQIPPEAFVRISITVDKIDHNISIEEYLNQKYPPNKYGLPSYQNQEATMEKITIDNQPGRLSEKGMLFENTVKTAWIKNNTRIYEITTYSREETGGEYSQKASRVFDQILSTFRFLD